MLSSMGLSMQQKLIMLNIILFGCKAKEWAQANPNLASKGVNIRETASINQFSSINLIWNLLILK